MFFTLILLFLLGYFVIWPLIKGALFLNNIKKRYNDTFEQTLKKRSTSKKNEKKIFGADEGEYIKFQEIKIEASEYKETTTDIPGSVAYEENQISDADWEEI